MSDDPRTIASADACVTASELVRQFGLWQERALQQPVFVLRRGRPSLVLTSLDMMRRLCAPHEAPADTILAARLMDTIRESALLVDAGGRIDDLNRAARLAFGAVAGTGQNLPRLFGEPIGRFLIDLADRARRLGAAEQAEIALRERRCRVVIVPHGEGSLILVDDVSAADESEAAIHRLAALETATDALTGMAWVRVNLRGYVDALGEGLATLTGIERSTLLAVRLVTLFDPASRIDVAEAIEAVIADGMPRRASGILQCRDGRTLATELSFAPERHRGGIEHVLLVLRVVHDLPNS